ncbi:MAG TPA: hypothetical protein VF175_00800 [Lacipirellula sp.]
MATRSAGYLTPLSIGIVAAVLVGCGGEEWAYLEGAVLLNGAPVGPGVVRFEPTQESRAGAIARFGEDGRYEAISSGRKEGLPPGEYRVAIEGGEDASSESISTPASKSAIPARYRDPSSSGLTVTVESGSQSHDFQLTP